MWEETVRKERDGFLLDKVDQEEVEALTYFMSCNSAWIYRVAFF